MLSKKLSFWKNKKILVTGHSGFKGGWLSLWLSCLGAKVLGISLKPNTNPSFYHLVNLKNFLYKSYFEDIRNRKKIENKILKFEPDIIFHLASQPIVSKSYKDPLLTYETNIIGTINLLQIIGKLKKVRSVIVVTSDKCYLQTKLKRIFKETDMLGGDDMYSSSKACQEIVTKSYYLSFFKEKNVSFATVRSGNAIGGGDWSEDRLVPDIVRSIKNKKKLILRNPNYIRPWQHVLDPLAGYLMVAKKIYFEKNYSKKFSSWNFGPNIFKKYTVSDLTKIFYNRKDIKKILIKRKKIKESSFLSLNASKAKKKLKWKPTISLNNAVKLAKDWYFMDSKKKSYRAISLNQIKYYMSISKNKI